MKVSWLLFVIFAIVISGAVISQSILTGPEESAPVEPFPRVPTLPMVHVDFGQFSLPTGNPEEPTQEVKINIIIETKQNPATIIPLLDENTVKGARVRDRMVMLLRNKETLSLPSEERFRTYQVQIAEAIEEAYFPEGRSRVIDILFL